MDNKLKKGDVVELDIIDISNEGSGIGRKDGSVVFVKDTMIGDTAFVEITKIKKNFCIGKLKELKTPSIYRNNQKNQEVNVGCDLINMTYEGQLFWKEKTVRDKLNRLAGLENPKVNKIMNMEHPEKYRNKVMLHISTGGIITKKGGIVVGLDEPKVGFYKKGSNEVIDLDNNILCNDVIETVAKTIKDFMIQDNITGYDPKWKRGLMKHAIVKLGFETGEVMVVMVVNGRGIPNGQKLVQMLDDNIYNLSEDDRGIKYSLESFIININKEDNSLDLSKENNIYLAGKHYIEDVLGNAKFEISPAAFYQVNPIQTKKLYDKALEYVDLKENQVILDLYCGVGSIGIYMAKDAECRKINTENIKIWGIDYEKSAILDANRNAVINGLVNVQFLCGKVEDKLPELVFGTEDEMAKISQVDTVILDPPRSGCDKSVLEVIKEVEAEKIVYISCDPGTLARDIKILGELGFEFIEATPVDMFPHTTKIETVALLSKLDVNKNI